MSFRRTVAALALALSSGAFAAPFDLGVLDDDDISFGREFRLAEHDRSPSLGNFTDYYSFRLIGTADASGGILSFDSRALDLSISRITLSGGTLGSQVSDDSPGRFRFSHLGAGTYLLGVSGRLSSDRGDSGQARYSGTIQAIAAPVPEPEHGLMLLAGLAGLVFVRRRTTSVNGGV